MSITSQYRRALIVAAIFVVGVSACCCGSYRSIWHYVKMDMGPFYGKATVAVPTGKPTSSVAVGATMTLEAWDAPTSSTAAILQMRDSRGGVLWKVETEGFTPGDPQQMQLYSADRDWPGYIVRGSVYGERATIYIGSDGRLKRYYYGW